MNNHFFLIGVDYKSINMRITKLRYYHFHQKLLAVSICLEGNLFYGLLPYFHINNINNNNDNLFLSLSTVFIFIMFSYPCLRNTLLNLCLVK